MTATGTRIGKAKAILSLAAGSLGNPGPTAPQVAYALKQARWAVRLLENIQKKGGVR